MEQNLIRLLKADEIECRVAVIKENGLSLLLYKDARVDQRILDETFGPFGWPFSFSSYTVCPLPFTITRAQISRSSLYWMEDTEKWSLQENRFTLFWSSLYTISAFAAGIQIKGAV